MEKKKILFVGEDPKLWPELHRQFSNPNSEWEAAFTRTAPQALLAMSQERFDAIVAEIELPGMSGAQLLDEVIQRHPQMLRFVRSEMSNNVTTMKCVATAHQHLVKPCDSQTVTAALKRAFNFSAWLPGDAVQGVMAQICKLPSPPKLYFQVVLELQSPEASVESVGAIIAKDIAISAKLLQLVNSAVFGLQMQVSHPAEAVMYLGMETTKSLILLAHTFSYFDKLKTDDFSIDELWRHSLATGKLAQSIAKAEGVESLISDQSFTAGMLHDIGILALAANLPEKFSAALTLAREQKLQLWEAESEIIGAPHAEVGACLLGIWGLPVPIVEAVALHHYPIQFLSKVFCPLTAVHVANVLEHETHSTRNETTVATVDSSYLAGMELNHRLDEWRNLSLDQVRTLAA